MAGSNVVVFAQIQAKAGFEGVVREVLTALVEPTRAEPGCLRYDLHQSTEDPRVFLFHEVWETEADLERHLETPHLAHLRERAPTILDGLPVLQRARHIA